MNINLIIQMLRLVMSSMKSLFLLCVNIVLYFLLKLAIRIARFPFQVSYYIYIELPCEVIKYFISQLSIITRTFYKRSFTFRSSYDNVITLFIEYEKIRLKISKYKVSELLLFVCTTLAEVSILFPLFYWISLLLYYILCSY